MCCYASPACDPVADAAKAHLKVYDYQIAGLKDFIFLNFANKCKHSVGIMPCYDDGFSSASG
eukprot:7216072-Karenia_brevis.AAC.1